MLVFLVGLALIGLGVFLGLGRDGADFSPSQPGPATSSQKREEFSFSTSSQQKIDFSNWKLYESEEYDFQINYPGDWKVATGEKEWGPMITIYKPETVSTATLPVDHFADLTHVSFYPEGIPTEGETGETATSELEFAEPVKEARDFILASGQPWATQVKFESYPESWNQNGFLWAKTQLQDLKVTCYREEEKIDSQDCDPLMGEDKITRKADINQKDRRTQEAMLSTFRFQSKHSGLDDLIQVETPRSEDKVESPLAIRGEARGTWFQEGEFPVFLFDGRGSLLATSTATTSEQSLTSEFIPFQAELEFSSPDSATGTLILEKAGISGFQSEPLKKELTVFFD